MDETGLSAEADWAVCLVAYCGRPFVGVLAVCGLTDDGDGRLLWAPFEYTPWVPA